MKKTIIALTTLLVILTACTALVFFVSVASLGYNIGSYKDFENDSDYITFDAKILSFTDYENCFSLELEHYIDRFNIGFDITDANYLTAKENGLTKDTLKENDSVHVTVATHFVGLRWNHTIVALQSGETEYLSFEDGKANLVEQQRQVSENSSRILLVTGILFGASALSLTATLIITKRKNEKAKKQAEKEH